MYCDFVISLPVSVLVEFMNDYISEDTSIIKKYIITINYFFVINLDLVGIMARSLSLRGQLSRVQACILSARHA